MTVRQIKVTVIENNGSNLASGMPPSAVNAKALAVLLRWVNDASMSVSGHFRGSFLFTLRNKMCTTHELEICVCKNNKTCPSANSENPERGKHDAE